MFQLNLISVHTLLSESSINVATEANSDKAVAFIYHQKKKILTEMKSGERGDQVLGPPLPIHFSGNL
jgi:hypothetical protein